MVGLSDASLTTWRGRWREHARTLPPLAARIGRRVLRVDETCNILMRAGLRQTRGVALAQAGKLAREREHLCFQLRIRRRLPWGAFLCVRDMAKPALRRRVGVLGARFERVEHP